MLNTEKPAINKQTPLTCYNFALEDFILRNSNIVQNKLLSLQQEGQNWFKQCIATKINGTIVITDHFDDFVTEEIEYQSIEDILNAFSISSYLYNNINNRLYAVMSFDIPITNIADNTKTIIEHYFSYLKTLVIKESYADTTEELNSVADRTDRQLFSPESYITWLINRADVFISEVEIDTNYLWQKPQFLYNALLVYLNQSSMSLYTSYKLLFLLKLAILLIETHKDLISKNHIRTLLNSFSKRLLMLAANAININEINDEIYLEMLILKRLADPTDIVLPLDAITYLYENVIEYCDSTKHLSDTLSNITFANSIETANASTDTIQSWQQANINEIVSNWYQYYKTNNNKFAYFFDNIKDNFMLDKNAYNALIKEADYYLQHKLEFEFAKLLYKIADTGYLNSTS